MGEPKGPPTDENEDPMIAMRGPSYMSSQRALRKAVEEAFKGVNFTELETAWKTTMMKVVKSAK